MDLYMEALNGLGSWIQKIILKSDFGEAIGAIHNDMPLHHPNIGIMVEIQALLAWEWMVVVGKCEINDREMDPDGNKSAAVLQEISQRRLHIGVMRRDWNEVVQIFKENPEIHATKINDMDDTALHSAITNGASETSVKELVDEIVTTKHNTMEALRAGNKRQDTPLHCAASRGSSFMCRQILRVDKSLVRESNIDGETPLFLAALNGHKETFLYLHSVCRNMHTASSIPLWKRNNGDSILHCTIHRKYFDLSFQIINLYKDRSIGSSFNDEGHIPLNVLASIQSAFKSGTRLSLWNKLLYHLIRVEKLKFDPPVESHVVDVENTEAQYQTQFIKSAYFWSQGTYRKIKEKHVWGEQLMEELIKQDAWYKYKANAMELRKNVKEKHDLSYVPYYHHMDREVQKGRVKRSTALLIAAKNGLIELVNKIFN
ncbi:uncharacterized protein LOC129286516 [Prosopis cineraria]|uniref:uncharacterized protein LOC129286516 n=1 Tax=Prosopis cineraria TaxID=364024 RepID=UPI00240EE550|nr:uncharacterized protein LOC129286516 [Prosopis cineraria]